MSGRTEPVRRTPMPPKTESIKIACIQNAAGDNWQANFESLEKKLIPQALRRSPDVIALPEMFLLRGASGQMQPLARTASPIILSWLQDLAVKHRTAVLAGSLPEPAPEKKYYNTSYFIDEKGRVLSRYRKMHLFDIQLKGKVNLQESRQVAAGKQTAVFKWRGRIWGQTICYDLRFPELYRRLASQGCEAVFVPANFTYATGQAHWEILLRARAIENQFFLIAPDQCGENPVSKLKSYGHSMIVSPWGDILARAGGERAGVIGATLKFSAIRRLRQQFPVLQHRKIS